MSDARRLQIAVFLASLIFQLRFQDDISFIIYFWIKILFPKQLSLAQTTDDWKVKSCPMLLELKRVDCTS